jgi:hypothetical protein
VTQHAKVLVLALDAASPVLLREWGADGTLPNIGRLLREGLSGPGRSLEGYYQGATWPSFMTGRSPGRHGIYWLYQARDGGYDQHRLTADQIGRFPALWDVLAGAGRRVAVLDVPFDRPRPSFSGLQVIEWYTHDPLFRFQTSPAHLASGIENVEGRHPAPAYCDAVRRTAGDYRAFIDQMTAGAALRSRISRRLLADTPWDLVIQVFAETHCSGHQLWHLHDPAHPGHDPALARRVGDGMREVCMPSARHRRDRRRCRAENASARSPACRSWPAGLDLPEVLGARRHPPVPAAAGPSRVDRSGDAERSRCHAPLKLHHGPRLPREPVAKASSFPATGVQVSFH